MGRRGGQSGDHSCEALGKKWETRIIILGRGGESEKPEREETDGKEEDCKRSEGRR